MKDSPLIFVVDDDESVRDSLSMLLTASGYRVSVHDSAASFLGADASVGRALIVDIRMPGLDGLQLLEVLARNGAGIPALVVTGHGDVPLVVRAMRAGAVDFIEKPFDDAALLASLERALALGEDARKAAAEAQQAQQVLSTLTRRERSVLAQLLVGRSNKLAAIELGISPRTVEIHRSHIMDKLDAGSLSDVVRITLAAGMGFVQTLQSTAHCDS